MFRINLLKIIGLMLTILGSNAAASESVWDVPDRSAEAQPRYEITVYRSANCKCCLRWIAHLAKHGFIAQDHVVEDIDAIKRGHGIPASMASCHTALVAGYLVEGHVPALDIKRMLSERPAIAGVAVPGMPVGTPGMEKEDGKDPFRVMAFDKEGGTSVYHEYVDY